MNEKQMEFIACFVEGIITSAQEHKEYNSYFGFDYIDEVEDSLKYDDLAYTGDEKQEMMKYIQTKLEAEYGYNDVHYGGSEQTVAIDGRIQTLPYQMVIRF